MKWRTHEGQGLLQNLQQWSGLMQNEQNFESVLWRMPEWVFCIPMKFHFGVPKLRTEMVTNMFSH